MIARTLAGLNALGGALVLALLLLVCADAFGRTFLSAPVLGVVELVEMSLVAIVFLQLGDATRSGRLTRSDGLLLVLDTSAPRLAAGLRALFELAGVAFMGLVLYGAVPRLVESWKNGAFKGTAQLFTAPEWPVKLIVVVGAAATLVAFAAAAVRWLARLRRH